MTPAKFVLRTILVAIVMFALGFIGHQLLLGHDYISIEPIMRSKPDMARHMPFALINSLCFSGAIVWMYSQGRSARAWLGQGIRFGIALWFVTSLPLYLTSYVIEPWPGLFVAKILAWEIVDMLVLGIVISALAKGDPLARP